jgi:glycosyltransferase involved in cell wall biosynthesis
LLHRFAPGAPAHGVTNGVDLDYFSPEPKSPLARGCVFVGAFDYRPNVDAACWFVREVWPELIVKHPETRLRLVGRNPVKAVRRLSSAKGVEVIGTVPDVRPYVREAAVAIAPLRLARGLQNKVLEALAMGKPVIASPQALAGFHDDVPAVTASNPSEWVHAIGRLLGDPEERRRLGSDGRAFAESRHNWNHCLKPMLGLLGLECRAPDAVTAGMAG